MPIFYHVSKNLISGNKFVPRIPLFKESDENNTIERICVSKTLGGCLTSMPQGEKGFSQVIGYTGGLLKVYKIDTDKLNISHSSIIDTEVLYRKDYVRDSFVTEECWITESFEVPKEDIFYINPYYWEFTKVDNVFHGLRVLAEKQFNNNLQEAWESQYGYRNLSSVQKIDNINYQVWNKDTQFVLYLYRQSLKELTNLVKSSDNVLSFQVFPKEECPIENMMVELSNNAYVVALELDGEQNEKFSKELFEILNEQYEMINLVSSYY